MIYGSLARPGLSDGGGLAARMWSQAAQRPAPQQLVGLNLPAQSIDLPPAAIDIGPVRLPGPALPGDGVSVIL